MSTPTVFVTVLGALILIGVAYVVYEEVTDAREVEEARAHEDKLWAGAVVEPFGGDKDYKITLPDSRCLIGSSDFRWHPSGDVCDYETWQRCAKATHLYEVRKQERRL